MTNDSDRDILDQDPKLVADPIERAKLLFIHWHIDEVIGESEATDYAQRLIEKLTENGLTIVHDSVIPYGCHRVQRDQLAGFDLVGRRLPDGRVQLGANEGKGEIVADFPADASLGDNFNTYTLEAVKKNNHDGTPGIEWGVYV